MNRLNELLAPTLYDRQDQKKVCTRNSSVQEKRRLLEWQETRMTETSRDIQDGEETEMRGENTEEDSEPRFDKTVDRIKDAGRGRKRILGGN